MTMKPLAVVLSAILASACSSSSDNPATSDGGTPSGDGGTSACTASATVTDVLTQVSGPVGRVAFDDKYIYVPGSFAEGDGVEFLARGAPPPGAPLASTPLPPSTPDLALVVDTDIYFVGALTGSIYKVAKGGGATSYTTVASGYSFTAQRRLAVDADAVYVLGNRGDGVVVDRIPRAGGAAQTLAQLGSGIWNMTVGDTDVWVSGGPIGSTGVQRIAKTGGMPTMVVPGSQCLQGFAVTADAILCADPQNLLRFPKAGGAPKTLYATPLGIDRIQDVAFSKDGAFAYVSDAMGQGNQRKSAILRVDTGSGASTTLACGLAPPRRLVVGPHDLMWTSSFVSVLTKFDVQTLGL
jgi:hypothetical protein